MKKVLKKGMLTLGILMVALFGVGGSAFAGYPVQHSIESVIVEPAGYPVQHSIESVIVEPAGYPVQHSIESAPVIVQPTGYPVQH